MVKFVKFERGHYKHLCIGSLTLEIDGKIVRFGDDIDDHYDRFWISGGDTYTDDRGNVFVYKLFVSCFEKLSKVLIHIESCCDFDHFAIFNKFVCHAAHKNCFANTYWSGNVNQIF